MLDLTDPFGPALALYTQAFYHACKRALRPGGVLSLHIQSPIHRPELMARILASLRQSFAVVRPYLQYVPLYGTLWGMACASDSADPLALDSEEVDARIARHGLRDLQLYSGAVHHALLTMPPFVSKVLSQPAAPIGEEEALGACLDPLSSQPLRLVSC